MNFAAAANGRIDRAVDDLSAGGPSVFFRMEPEVEAVAILRGSDTGSRSYCQGDTKAGRRYWDSPRFCIDFTIAPRIGTKLCGPRVETIIIDPAIVLSSMFVVLFEDSAAMLGLTVAAAGIFLSQITANPIYDGLASIIIGLILAATAAWLAYETKGLLIGESANKEVIQGIRKIAQSHNRIQHINEVLTLHMGPDFILLNLSVDFDNTASAGDVEKAIARLNQDIKQSYLRIKRIFIEAEARRQV